MPLLLRSLGALLALSLVVSATQAQSVVYPTAAGVVDVTQPPYNAVPDDGLDDTAAINGALADHPDGNFIIYLPDGTYDVSDRLNWPRIDAVNDPNCGIEQACRYTVMQGESRDGTVLRLADNAPGYGDPGNRKAVIWTGAGTAQRFRNGVRGLTVHTGSGNAGAVGLQFQASNRGGIEDVRVVSGDGQGVFGIDFAYDDEIGPLLVKDVEVVGFDVGVATNFNVNSMTFENLTLRDQNVYGMRLLQQVVTIRGLQSTNAVPAVWAFNQGSSIALIDSELNGTAGGTAIIYGSQLFARNVATPGYDRAVGFLLNGTTLVGVGEDDAYVDEYVSDDVLRGCINTPRSLGLPIAETPTYAFPDTTQWATITDFGADETDNLDDTAAIQAALLSGAEVVVFPVTSFRARTNFLMDGTVTVPPTVRAIVGAQSRVGGDGLFVVESSPEPLLFQDLQGLNVDHAGDRVLVVKHASLDAYAPTSGADLFLEDVQVGPLTFRDQNVWARQVNIERGTGEQSLVNDGADFWLLGYKTEKRGVKIETIGGGRTELIGAHIYSTQGPSDEPMFRSVESSISLANVRETNFTSTPYTHLVEETRGGVTQVLMAADGTPGGIGGAGWPLYVGYVPDGPNAAPTVDAGPGRSLLLPDQTTATLQGFANDDGLPGTSCLLPATWTQVAGPATATLSDPAALDPTVTVSEPGTYVFRLTADDGALQTSDDVTIHAYGQARTTAEGDGADARVFGPSNGGRNYGAGAGLPVRRYLTFNNKAYLRFDLSGLENLEDAALVLDIATTNTGQIQGRTYNVFGLLEAESYGDGRLDEMWGEGDKDGEEAAPGEISWGTAPANTNSGGGAYDPATNTGGGLDNSLATFLGTFTPTVGQRDTVEFRSQALTAFLQGDTNGLATLIVTRVESQGGSIAFAAKENTDGLRPPTLLLTAGETTAPPADTTLVAYWPFDDEAGPVALDASGNGHDATLTGDALFAEGLLDGSVELDGAGDVLTVAPFEVTGEALTLAGWVYADDLGSDEARIVSKATGVQNDEHVWMLSTRYHTALRFRLKAGGSTSVLISEEGALQPGRWHHVAATYNGEYMRLFRNGTEIAQHPKTGLLDPAPEVPIAIGNQPVGAGERPFDGRLDDLRIYSRALPADELAALAEAGAPPAPDPLAWHFDGSDPLASDDGGVTGMLRAGATVGSGYEGDGLVLDGTDGAFDLPPLTPADTAFSIALWFRSDSTGHPEGRFVSQATGVQNDEHVWMLSTRYHTALRFRLKAGSGTTRLLSDSGLIEPGRWHHAVATYDGQHMRLYLDGAEVAETPKTGFVILAPDVPVAIGNQPVGAGDRPFGGQIDDVRLLPYALSAADVAALAGNAPSAHQATEDLAPDRLADVPDRFALEAAYPNPFNPQTTIRYGLPEAARARLSVFDVLGRQVATLVDGEQAAGWHTVRFDARALPSGLYFYRLEAGGLVQVRQMTLLR